MATHAFYIHIDHLRSTLDRFEANESVGKKVLKGIIFLVGQRPDGTDALLPHGLYSASKKGGIDPRNDIIVPYNDGGGDPPPCPYPPGYSQEKRNKK